jgi:hypothetical protein
MSTRPVSSSVISDVCSGMVRYTMRSSVRPAAERCREAGIRLEHPLLRRAPHEPERAVARPVACPAGGARSSAPHRRGRATAAAAAGRTPRGNPGAAQAEPDRERVDHLRLRRVRHQRRGIHIGGARIAWRCGTCARHRAPSWAARPARDVAAQRNVSASESGRPPPCPTPRRATAAVSAESSMTSGAYSAYRSIALFRSVIVANGFIVRISTYPPITAVPRCGLARSPLGPSIGSVAPWRAIITNACSGT